jgi:hypothetical protein
MATYVVGISALNFVVIVGIKDPTDVASFEAFHAGLKNPFRDGHCTGLTLSCLGFCWPKRRKKFPPFLNADYTDDADFHR